VPAVVQLFVKRIESIQFNLELFMKIKRALFPIVLLATALLWPAAVQAQSYYTNGVDIYSYTATAGNITLMGYLGSGSALTVPDTIGFTPVTGIESFAFAGTSVAGVMLGTNMTNISAAAFANCPNCWPS
jgi:hypothetical protein